MQGPTSSLCRRRRLVPVAEKLAGGDLDTGLEVKYFGVRRAVLSGIIAAVKQVEQNIPEKVGDAYLAFLQADAITVLATLHAKPRAACSLGVQVQAAKDYHSRVQKQVEAARKKIDKAKEKLKAVKIKAKETIAAANK